MDKVGLGLCLPEPDLGPNFEQSPAAEEVYTELIPSNSTKYVVPPGNWTNPPAKPWALSECNESWDALKPGLHEQEDEIHFKLYA